jgi:hypothetical protein
MVRQTTCLPNPDAVAGRDRRCDMNGIFYIIGVVVVVLAILSLLGLG